MGMFTTIFKINNTINGETKMTNEVKLFNNEMFGEVRVVMKEDTAWFVASDVANVLGIKLTADMTRTLDEDEKDMDSIHILGGEQKSQYYQ